MLQNLLQYNAENLTSIIEDNRNNNLEMVYGNRNPFIDNSSIATVIWGLVNAYNRWKNLSVDEFLLKNYKIYPNPVRGNILNIEVKQNASFEIYKIFKKRNLEGNATPTNKDVNMSRLNKGVYI